MSNITPPLEDDKESDTPAEGINPSENAVRQGITASQNAVRQESERRNADAPQGSTPSTPKTTPSTPQATPELKIPLPQVNGPVERIGPEEGEDILNFYEKGGLPYELDAVYGSGKEKRLQRLKKEYEAGDWPSRGSMEEEGDSRQEKRIENGRPDLGGGQGLEAVSNCLGSV